MSGPTQPVIRAIGVSHTDCNVEFQQNIRYHIWSVLYIFWADSSYHVVLNQQVCIGETALRNLIEYLTGSLCTAVVCQPETSPLLQRKPAVLLSLQLLLLVSP